MAPPDRRFSACEAGCDMRKLLPALSTALLLALGNPAPAAAQTLPLPNSMASTGDSITRAFDSTIFGCFLTDCPQYSWSTGTSPLVDSQYRRILAVHPAIFGNAYNDARTGAKMADLPGQLQTAAVQRARYVTVLMGANDLCTSSAATMTPTAIFQAELQQALSGFFAADPKALLYLSSLPDLFQLWLVLHDNPTAESVWQAFHICQSLLAATNTDADRQLVVGQEAADNAALQATCARFANCRWDGYAGFNFKFPASDISTIDFFHPNLRGQNDIAAITWAASYWGG